MTPVSDQASGAVVGIFEDRLQAADAVHALEAAGFDPDRIGYAIRDDEDRVISQPAVHPTDATSHNSAAAGALEGGMIGGVLGALVGLIIPGIGPVLVGGLLASFFGGAIAGTAVGGLLGALNGLGISSEEAEFYQRQFEAGHAIVAVRAGARSAEAAEILQQHGAHRPTADAMTAKPESAYLP